MTRSFSTTLGTVRKGRSNALRTVRLILATKLAGIFIAQGKRDMRQCASARMRMKNGQDDMAFTLENFAKLAVLKLSDLLQTKGFIARCIHAVRTKWMC